MKLIFLICLCLLTTRGISSEDSNQHQYRLVFEDNFEFFDDKKWEYEENFRHSAQNSREMVRVEDGKLIITTENKDQNYKTGIVKTKFTGLRGYWEIRAKFGKINKGIWVAAWTYFPHNYEIDLFENRSFDINDKNISGYITSSVHWNGYGPAHKSIGNDSGERNLDKNYHIYGLEITDSEIIWYIDGKRYWKVYNLEVEKPLNLMNLIISVEMSSLLDGWTKDLPKNNFKEDVIFVDWVKIYAKQKL